MWLVLIAVLGLLGPDAPDANRRAPAFRGPYSFASPDRACEIQTLGGTTSQARTRDSARFRVTDEMDYFRMADCPEVV